MATQQGARLCDPANTVMDEKMCMELLKLVTLVDDETMLTEIHEDFMAKHGVEVSLATICRAMARLKFTTKMSGKYYASTPTTGRESLSRPVVAQSSPASHN